MALSLNRSDILLVSPFPFPVENPPVHGRGTSHHLQGHPENSSAVTKRIPWEVHRKELVKCLYASGTSILSPLYTDNRRTSFGVGRNAAEETRPFWTKAGGIWRRRLVVGFMLFPPESFQGVAESLPALFSFQVNTLEGVLSAFPVHGIKLAHFGFRVDFHGDPPSGVIPFCLPSFFPPDFHVRGVGRRTCLRGRGAENISGWCERRDSNPHAVRHENLNLGRLPISPLSPWKGWRKLVDIFLPPVVSHSLLAKKRPPNRKDPGV